MNEQPAKPGSPPTRPKEPQKPPKPGRYDTDPEYRARIDAAAAAGPAPTPELMALLRPYFTNRRRSAA